MIHISLERAVEELVGMFFDNKNITVLYLTTSKTGQTLFDNILREIYQQDKENVCRHSNLAKTIDFLGNHIEIKTLENNLRFTSYRFDIVFIDTKIDPKFHDEIRLSLRQNSVIPKEKQIQLFDIEQDKVWFEDEYQAELCKTFICEWAKLYYPNQAQQIEWIQKQLEEGYIYKNRMELKKKREDAVDSMIMSRLAYDMTVAADKYVLEKLSLTEEERGEEEPMNNFTINVEMGKTRVPTIIDIEVLKVLDLETGVSEPKVTKVFFADDTSMKMVCHEEDTFDLRRCLFISIAKKLYKDRYTWEGIEHKATELSYLKSVTKVVDKALKNYNNKIKAIEKEENKIAEKERIAENKKRKHEKYLKCRDEKRQREKDEEMRKKFEYDVAVQVEAARRIADMNHIWNNECASEWDGK